MVGVKYTDIYPPFFSMIEGLIDRMIECFARCMEPGAKKSINYENDNGGCEIHRHLPTFLAEYLPFLGFGL
jgi:hypothetical protein